MVLRKKKKVEEKVEIIKEGKKNPDVISSEVDESGIVKSGEIIEEPKG